MIESIFIGLLFYGSGARVETQHPSMASCVEHLLSAGGNLANPSGYCDEKVDGLTVCSTSVIGAPFWGKSEVFRPWCLDVAKIERLRNLPASKAPANGR